MTLMPDGSPVGRAVCDIGGRCDRWPTACRMR
eukprot:CAMPEP_0204159102 /NCGR_PEP_ID=MMETSP0361-20130328/32695_1 /ASSEMBLY_ACC=CAM_ASM_000343 /TAXON_ID=268821 /ORGANISM="Scrippsiella Hangoei, Strain SHTV-5" /LENGTH=31 /DNA_ID= /DNA_START= /DNA_END= /DNA_ORIENTATION=